MCLTQTSIGSNYESSAIFLNTADQSTLGTLKSDVLINDVDNADYDTWKVNSTDLGNYVTASDKMYELVKLQVCMDQL